MCNIIFPLVRVIDSKLSDRLYVGSLHFNLTESDIKQVFEPFGELEFVDLHRDPMTGRSKGYAFVQYKRSEDAKMALEQMEGFELAGRTVGSGLTLMSAFLLRRCSSPMISFVSTRSMRRGQQDTLNKIRWMKQAVRFWIFNVPLKLYIDSFVPGGNLNAASRQALMQKLARIEPAPSRPEPV